MKQQERHVSDSPETALLSSGGRAYGENETALFIRALATALGFGVSAGWDWLPAMHALWLRDYLEAADVPGPFGVFETLSGTIFFKIFMLLALYPLIERLFMAFPLERSGRSSRPGDGGTFSASGRGERLYLMVPFLLMQAAGVALLALLAFFPPHSSGWGAPWLLGAISALFGSIWFVLTAFLPGMWSCFAYALALASSFFIALLLEEAPPETLARFRILFPLLALPLVYFAIPPVEEIQRRWARHRRQRLFGARMRGFFLRGLLLRRLSFSELLFKQGSGLLVMLLFPMMYGLQQLLDFSTGCPLICIGPAPDPILPRQTYLILSGEVCGAFLATSLVAFFPGHVLLSPMLGLSLFGCGTLMTSVFPEPPINSLAFYALHVASGCCAAFSLFVLHRFFQRSNFLFRTISRVLVLVTLLASVGGSFLAVFAEGIRNRYMSDQALFMHLLTLGSIVCLFSVYLMRRPLARLLDPEAGEKMESSSPLAELPAADPFESLTPREREVAELVRTGMKNLEISLQLNISETTLRVHLRRIYRKLGIRGRPNLREFNHRDEAG